MEQTTTPPVGQQRMVSPLRHGTEEEHRATLKRAKAAGVSYVWSGDVRRNQYLAENLRFAQESGILSTEWVESDQESGWKLKWANDALCESAGRKKTHESKGDVAAPSDSQQQMAMPPSVGNAHNNTKDK